MPPTASPSPFQSSAPRRMSGPKRTVPRSRSSTGTPEGPLAFTEVEASAPMSWM